MTDADVTVYVKNLPHRVKGFCRENPDGTYTVILNARLSYEQNCTTYLHEERHIYKHDFSRQQDVGEIELAQRQLLSPLK